MKRAERMTAQRWSVLSAFDWSGVARANWKSLTEGQRRAVVAAYKAEEAASVAYNRAVSALEEFL